MSARPWRKRRSMTPRRLRKQVFRAWCAEVMNELVKQLGLSPYWKRKRRKAWSLARESYMTWPRREVRSSELPALYQSHYESVIVAYESHSPPTEGTS